MTEHISYRDGSAYHDWSQMYRDACSLLEIPTKRLSLYDRAIQDIYTQEDAAWFRSLDRILEDIKDGRLEARDVMMLFECRP